MKTYSPPVVTDYGRLIDLTDQIDFAGPEDGGLKQTPIGEPPIPHHS